MNDSPRNDSFYFSESTIEKLHLNSNESIGETVSAAAEHYEDWTNVAANPADHFGTAFHLFPVPFPSRSGEPGLDFVPANK